MEMSKVKFNFSRKIKSKDKLYNIPLLIAQQNYQEELILIVYEQRGQMGIFSETHYIFQKCNEIKQLSYKG